jgi:PAS domain S-box-containing protein
MIVYNKIRQGLKKIWKRLFRSFEIPFNPIDDDSSRENIVSSLLNIGIMILLPYILFGSIERGIFSPQISLVIAMVVTLFVFRIAVGRGKSKLVSLLLISTSWVFATIIFMFFENGLRAPALMAVYVFIIVYVGLLHGQKSVILITALSLLVSIVVGWMELQGIFLTEIRIPDIRWTIMAQILFFPTIAFIVFRTLAHQKQSISLYREEIKKLSDYEIELQSHRDQLAKLVDERTAELQESEARYRSVVEDQTEYICRWKPDGTLTFVNNQFADLYGKSPNNLINTNFFKLTSKASHKRIQQTIQKLSPERPVIIQEYLGMSQGTRGKWYQRSDRGVFDKDECLIEIQSVSRDITEQKTAEEALQRSYALTTTLSNVAAKIQSTLDTKQVYQILEDELLKLDIKYYVVLLDPENYDLIVQHVGIGSKALSALENIIGVSSEDFRIPRMNIPFYEALIEQNEPQIISDVLPLFKVMLPKFPKTFINAIVKMLGVNTSFKIIMIPLIADERTIGYIAVWGEKLDESDVPAFYIFASQVASALRVSELYKQSQVANQAKTDFLSRMSHELRTPMNSILGFAQLMEISQKEPLTKSQREHVHQIIEGGKHLLNLINEILDLSRIEASSMQISPEPIKIRDAMREACDLARPLAEVHEIHVTLPKKIDENLFVLADHQRLKQVCLNLMSNAIKYNRPGGSVTITHETLPNRRLRISVTDTGLGIAPEDLGKIFIPFERLNANSSEVEGTGLGLALSKRLVEMMGGNIGVESTFGQGSTFWVELPITDSPGTHLSRKRTDPLVLYSGKQISILYIEDNQANYELVKQVLAEYPKIELLGANRAEKGIELARQFHPDLILLDLHLPGMNGQEALRHLKSDITTSSIPVIILSANATPIRIKEIKELGAEAYLTKPLNIKEFINQIAEFMKKG